MKYALLALVVLCSPPFGSDLTQAQLRDVQEFGAAGINFSTTQKEFRNLYPNAVQVAEKAAGCTIYSLVDASGTASGIRVGFLDDKLAVLGLMYRPEKANSYGVDVLEASVSEKFGREFVVVGPFRVRDFPQVDRRVATNQLDDGTWCLAVMCSSRADEFMARLGESGIGF